MAAGFSGGPITVDQPTLNGMLSAFGECQSECTSIQGQVDAAGATLGVHWQSDDAAPTYFRALDGWVDGFEKVRQGLNMLNSNMQEFSQLSNTTEGTGTSYAGGWAR